MNPAMKLLMSIMGVILGFWILLVTFVFEAWVIRVIWNWHLAGLTGIQLTVTHVMVFSLIFTLCTTHLAPSPVNGFKQKIERIATNNLLMPSIALLVGWLLTWK